MRCDKSTRGHEFALVIGSEHKETSGWPQLAEADSAQTEELEARPKTKRQSAETTHDRRRWWARRGLAWSREYASPDSEWSLEYRT